MESGESRGKKGTRLQESDLEKEGGEGQTSERMNCGSRHCESLQEANRCRQAGPGWRREVHALAH